MTRDQAWNIVCQYVKNEGLRKHMLAVEAAMGGYWEHFSSNSKSEIINSKQEWELAGLLHDFDWEIHPDETHPAKGSLILEKEGVSEHIRRAILSHAAERTGVNRASLMEKTLFAVDELTGLIIATALVKGKRISDVTLESVKKKWKEKSFAKGVNRTDIEQGARELDVPLDQHIQIVLEALQGIAKQLGL